MVKVCSSQEQQESKTAGDVQANAIFRCESNLFGYVHVVKKNKTPPPTKQMKKPRRDYSGSRALISGGGTWVTHGIWSEAGRDRRRKGWHTNLCVQSVVDNTTVMHKIMIQPAIHHCLWKTAASFPNCDRAGGLEMMPSQTVLRDTLIQSSASHTLAK